MPGLSHRERVRLALDHKPTDRPPMDLGSTVVSGLTLGAYRRLANHLTLESPEDRLLSKAFQIVLPDERILQRFDIDFRPVFYRPPCRSNERSTSPTSYTDEWGIVRSRPEGGLYFDIISSPLEDVTIDGLRTCSWPNPLDEGRFDGIVEEARHLALNTDYAIVGPGMDANLFELAWFLRGFETLLVDLVVNPSFVHALMERLLEYRKAMIGRYLEMVGRYLDVVYVADDLAMQTGPLISPKKYREIVKPYQAEYYRFIKSRTEAKLLLHCCGAVSGILDDLIEIGVDIINPVQVSARGMDAVELKTRFGDRVCFWGGIDTQHVLPCGTTNDVREEVRRRIADLGAGGGYVLAPVHSVQPDVPPENLCALYEEAIGQAGSGEDTGRISG